MHLTSLIAIYFLLWVFCVFLVLPFYGNRDVDQPDPNQISGQAYGSPPAFPVGKIALRVTILATSVFILFVLNYHFGWIGPETIDTFGWMKPPS